MTQRQTAERETLTGRQQEVYDFIRQHIEEFQRPPTFREIGAEFGISSTNGVMSHLRALSGKGWIDRDAWSSNGIRLTNVKITITDL